MIMWPLLLLILINSLAIEAYPVLVFNNTQSLKKQDPSYAFLAKEVHLPEEFTLCSSIKQARFDDVGFFTIRGQTPKNGWKWNLSPSPRKQS